MLPIEYIINIGLTLVLILSLVLSRNMLWLIFVYLWVPISVLLKTDIYLTYALLTIAIIICLMIISNKLFKLEITYNYYQLNDLLNYRTVLYYLLLAPFAYTHILHKLGLIILKYFYI